MRVVADRFLCGTAGSAVDLASGERVLLRSCARREPRLQAEWSVRCASLFDLWHPNLATLVDFGLIGDTGVFEAWGLPESSRSGRPSDPAAIQALLAVTQFLHANELSAGGLSWRHVWTCGARAVVVPAESSGYQDSNASREWARLLKRLSLQSGETRAGDRAPGLVLQPFGGTLDQVVDLIESAQPGDMRCVYLRGARGCGVSTLLRKISREARLHGYVPLSPRLLGSLSDGREGPSRLAAELLSKRHVALICDRNGEVPSDDHVAHLMLKAGLTSARPNLAVIATGAAGQARSVVDVRPFSRQALVRAVRPVESDWKGRVAEAARAAGGRPGMFVQALLGRGDRADQTANGRQPGLLRETPPRYESPTSTTGRREDPSNHKAPEDLRSDEAAPGSSELQRAGERVERARALVRQGLHAAAERQLRQTLGYFGRRGDNRRAGCAAQALGALLLARGRAAEAGAMFEQARELCGRANDLRGAARAAVHAGLAWTDDDRLMQAEAALRAARMAAEHIGALDVAGFARVALARCLFWQRRYEEAQHCLGHVDSDATVRESPDASSALRAVDASQPCRVACMGARLALAREDLAPASRLAVAALDMAEAGGEPCELAAAHAVMAAVQAKLGHVKALADHCTAGDRAACRAHAPLMRLRLRLTLAEGLRDAGPASEYRALVRKLARRGRRHLPRLLRARLERLVNSLECPTTPVPAPLHVNRCASPAVEANRNDHAPADSGLLRQLMEVLQLCCEAEQEREMLDRVCGLLRSRWRARRAGFFSGGRLECVGGDARWKAPLVVRRAVETGLLVPPTRTADGIEAAAPVRYGGATIAALGCRWPVEIPVAPTHVAWFMAAVAAACAPGVHMVMEEVTAPSPTSPPAECELIGHSQAIEAVRRAVERAAGAPFQVLIQGDSGTGKELVARAVHRLGPRRARRFCAVNCAALTEDLLEAELFGHARGAFTGAIVERAGLFEEADGGTLFLDEVAELSPRAQAKLLRVLQEGEIRRVGENISRRIDARIVAATNRSLEDAVRRGAFRQDLLYRLDVIRIAIPPLRERPEDVASLGRHFWSLAAARTGSRAVLTGSALAALARYDWPGNVRELQNVMAALVVAAPTHGRVGPSLLPGAIARAASLPAGVTLDGARRQFEERFVRAALARAGGHRGRAAAELGLSRQGLSKLLRRIGRSGSSPAVEEPVGTRARG